MPVSNVVYMYFLMVNDIFFMYIFSGIIKDKQGAHLKCRRAARSVSEEASWKRGQKNIIRECLQNPILDVCICICI